MAPGVDTERAPADKAADGLGVIDPVARKLTDRWHAGSDPEEFAISKDGKSAFVANEDDASVLMIDLGSGQPRGKVKVSEEPEGMGVNPANGEVYVTCEEKGEVFVIAPEQQRVVAKIDTGGRPRSVAFLPDGSRAYVACETTGSVAVIDTASHKQIAKDPTTGRFVADGHRDVLRREGAFRFNRPQEHRGGDRHDEECRDYQRSQSGTRAWGIALSPDGSKLYSANGASDDVSVVDVKTRKELKRIKVGSGPWGVTTVRANK